jgi:arylsulfatase A-like enzyme
VLLARRLVEAGARFVTVNWGREEQDWADGVKGRFANNPWDTHRNHFPLLTDSLLPRADRALAALVDDLTARGLFDDVLVVWMGEFGRTPVISKPWASRDHWPNANTILFAGGGSAGGHVVGRTDARAAEVTDARVTPADVVATLLAARGLNPRAEVADRQGRPFPACDGTPIERVFAG